MILTSESLYRNRGTTGEMKLHLLSLQPSQLDYILTLAYMSDRCWGKLVEIMKLLGALFNKNTVRCLQGKKNK